MTGDGTKPATKNDLGTISADIQAVRTELREEIQAVRTELKEEIQGVREDLKKEVAVLTIANTELRDEMRKIKDEIIRAFGITEENIRRDCAHADEVVDLCNRVSRIEDHVDLAKQ